MQKESIKRRKRYLYVPPIVQFVLAFTQFADEPLTTGSTEWLRQNGLTPTVIGTTMLVASFVLFVWLARVRVNHISWAAKVIVAFVLTTPTLMRTFASAYYLWVVSITGSDYTLGVLVSSYIFTWLFFREGLLAGEEEAEYAAHGSPPASAP